MISDSALLYRLQMHDESSRRAAIGLLFTAGLFFCSATVAVSAFGQVSLPKYEYINTVAGNGTQGYSGDGGAATNAELGHTWGVAVDASGNIYIADWQNQRIRKVTASTGAITTVAGNGSQGFAGDGGPATSAKLNDPQGVALDVSGNIYIADTYNNCVRKVNSSSGVITTVAGACSYSPYPNTGSYSGDGGPATSAKLNGPAGIALDANGNIYIADFYNFRVRKVTVSSGIITTVAGNGTGGYNGDNQLATSAELYAPVSVALDGYGNIYIAEDQNNRIREVTVSTGIITTVAGTGAAGSSGDGGLAIVAELNFPSGVAVDTSGDIFISDYNNNRVREVENGNIKTVAGDGTKGYSGDGGMATSAELYWPSGVTLDSIGNIYIGDTVNNRVRVVGGQLTTTTFNPVYKVVSILYSPPGNQSTEGYGLSTTTGTTTTVGSSFSFQQQYSVSTGIPGIFSAGGSTGTSYSESTSEAFTQTFTDATTLTSSDNSSTTFNPTASNDINHHLDTFEIWLNPLVTFESNGTTPVNYSVTSQPTTVNGVQVPYVDVVGVPAIAMEAAPAGVTALNPSGTAGVSTVPVDLLVPQALSQTGQGPAYMPGLGAICANNTLYQQQWAANLAGNPNPGFCTLANQCGCTPADFAAILQTDPLLNYDSTTYTANPYDGTVSPLEADSLPTSSGPGSGPATCELNKVPANANCRYVVLPAQGTNTGSGNAVPWTIEMEGGIQSPGVSISDGTTTAETIGGSTGYSTSLSAGGGPLFLSLKVQDTWTWTDSESMGNSYGTANSTMVTLKSSTAACDETASLFEDTVYHTYAFQIPAGNAACNPGAYSITVTPNGSTALSLGHSISYTVTVTPLYGFSGTVTLATANLPIGVTESWSTTTINTSGTATLTLTAAYSSSTYIGNSTVTVTGTSGSSATSADFPLTTRPLQYRGTCGVQ